MRKQPKQQRSRQMVDRILEAAAKVLQAHGLASFGTRHVADEAGISVGSLYQYFADKDALLEALGRRLIEQIQSEIAAVLPSLNGVSSGEFIRILITTCDAVLTRDDGRNMALLQHWNALPLSTDVVSVERLLMQYVEIFSATQPALRALPDKQRTLYIGINSVVFNLMRYANQPSPYFDRAALLEGLIEMLELYVEQRFLAAQQA